MIETVAEGVVVHGGGQWVGKVHTRILALARELGVATAESYSSGVLLAFGAGDQLPSDVGSRKDAVTAAPAKFFGKEALEPTGFVEMDWMSEAWSTGCASPLKPGDLSAHGRALREPVGRIHWAGTDTSPIWNGFMEGAVRSGARVAGEVVAALRESSIELPATAPPAEPG